MKFFLLHLTMTIEPGAPGLQEFLLALSQAEAAKRAGEQVHVVTVIHSRGGVIDLGRLIGQALRNVQATCMVSRAYSAALQGVLPGCHRIVAARDSEFIFHSASTMLPADVLFSGADFYQLTQRSTQISEGMAADMRQGFGPMQPASCAQLRTKWAQLPKPSCEVLHMFEETRFTGDKFTTLFPATVGRVTLTQTRKSFLPKDFDFNGE
jgi:hypothetical protein